MRRFVVMFFLLGGCGGVHAQEIDPADLEGRIEYAYFTADANALRNLILATQNSLAKGSSGVLAHYQRGQAQYRLGQLLETQNDAKAAEAFSGCIEALGKAIDADKLFADGYALQSACHTNLAALKGRKVVVDLTLGGSRLDKALKLAPKNPRVALFDALNDYERPHGGGGDRKGACSKFEKVAQLFDAVDETRLPGWGAADAYLYVGRCLSEEGDVLGARNALERALIIAPDFAAARAELRRVVAPRS